MEKTVDHPSSIEDTSSSSSSLLMQLNKTSFVANENDVVNSGKQKLKVEIDSLIENYLSKNAKLMIDFSDSSSSADSNNTASTSSANDELFMQNLFEILIRTKHKGKRLLVFF
jgi:hypothetical protein